MCLIHIIDYEWKEGDLASALYEAEASATSRLENLTGESQLGVRVLVLRHSTPIFGDVEGGGFYVPNALRSNILLFCFFHDTMHRAALLCLLHFIRPNNTGSFLLDRKGNHFCCCFFCFFFVNGGDF